MDEDIGCLRLSGPITPNHPLVLQNLRIHKQSLGGGTMDTSLTQPALDLAEQAVAELFATLIWCNIFTIQGKILE
jgi:hypothetical protein